MRSAALLASMLGAGAAAGAACPPAPEAGQRLDAGPVQLAWRAEPEAIAVSRPFALLVTLCPADARLRRVDASMPEHRHGMNYRPSLRALGDGVWRAEGLLFHMPGKWQFVFDLERPGRTERLTADVLVE